LKFLPFLAEFPSRMFEGGLEGVRDALNLVLAALRSYRAWLAAAAVSIHIARRWPKNAAM
jgi:hypothetical protein